jgi:hypothetical protein
MAKPSLADATGIWNPVENEAKGRSHIEAAWQVAK